MNVKKDVEDIAELTKSYAENYFDEIKLKVIKNLVMSISKALLFFVIGLLFVVFLILTNVGASFYLGKVLDSTSLGFIIVASINLLIILLIGYLRKRLFARLIANYVVMEIVEDWIKKYK